MKIFATLIFVLLALSAQDFITKMEYAKMLYANPKGIGCDSCHGKKGEGMIISTYKDKGLKKELKAPRIDNLSRKEFFMAFGESNSVMPTYFLTDNEIEILYFYVTSEVNQ